MANNKRDFEDPRYIEWRKAIRKRDGAKCRFPACSSRRKLRAHHIRRWADCPALRFDPNNGITLCEAHHDIVTGNEKRYERMFQTILNPSLGGCLVNALRYANEIEQKVKDEEKNSGSA